MAVDWSMRLVLLDSFVIPLLAVIFGILWLRDYWRYKDLPPGPRGWPIIGNLFSLGNYPYETLEKLSDKYGSVYSLKLGTQRAIVLNDYESVREAFVDQADIFSERPPIFVFDHAVKNRDIATAKSPIWREQRRFMLLNMKSFGFGKSNSEDMIMESVQMVMDEFDASIGKPLSFQYMFFLPILNIIWKYSANHPLPKNSANARDLCDLITANFQALGNRLINFLPALRFVPGGFKFSAQYREQLRVFKFLADEIEAHRKAFVPGQHNDFIDVYLEEILKRKGTEDEGKAPFNDDHLAGTLFDLFLGGSDTTSNTLLWGFLLLSINPEIQQKVQKEMDNVIGRGRLPCFSDMTRLPYLEATIQEIHRRVSLIPLSIFHAPSKDTIFRGYLIPKGTTIIQNIYAVHRDPKCWTNPDEFRPERFLDENNRVLKPPYLMPFSVGPRICPGEAMARMELQLFFSTLLQKYSFSLPPGEATPSLVPIVGQSLAPAPYSLCVNYR